MKRGERTRKRIFDAVIRYYNQYKQPILARQVKSMVEYSYPTIKRHLAALVDDGHLAYNATPQGWIPSEIEQPILNQRQRELLETIRRLHKKSRATVKSVDILRNIPGYARSTLTADLKALTEKNLITKYGFSRGCMPSESPYLPLTYGERVVYRAIKEYQEEHLRPIPLADLIKSTFYDKYSIYHYVNAMKKRGLVIHRKRVGFGLARKPEGTTAKFYQRA